MKKTMEELSVRITVLERKVAQLYHQVEKLMGTDGSKSPEGLSFHLSSLPN